MATPMDMIAPMNDWMFKVVFVSHKASTTPERTAGTVVTATTASRGDWHLEEEASLAFQVLKWGTTRWKCNRLPCRQPRRGGTPEYEIHFSSVSPLLREFINNVEATSPSAAVPPPWAAPRPAIRNSASR